MNELEIMLASENRQISPGQQQPMQPKGGGGQGHNRPQGQSRGQQGHGQQQPQGQQPHGQQQERKFHKRPRRRKTP